MNTIKDIIQPTIMPKSDLERGCILRLPPEILHIIFELALRDGERYCRYTTKSLTLTCHCFLNLAIPFLYKTIKLEVPGECRRHISLNAALQKTPSLGQYCNALWIDIGASNATPIVYSAVNYIIQSLRSVKSLRISHSGYNVGYRDYERSDQVLYMWKLIDTVAQHMPQLEELRLGIGRYRIELRDLVESIDIPSLKHLSLDGILFGGIAPISDTMKYRTASFTSLTISDYENDHANVLQQLLSWPKALSHFCWNNSMYRVELQSAIAQSIQFSLLMHKETLKSLDLEGIPWGHEAHWSSTSIYPNLEVLRLSRDCLRGIKGEFRNNLLELTAADAGSLLLTPKLKVFVLNYGTDGIGKDGYPKSCWITFGDGDENLLCQLAKAAIDGKTELRKILIQYNPPKDEISDYNDVYPWDRMERIRDDIQPFGLILEYDVPQISKREFMDCIELKRFYEETTLDDDMVIAQSPDRLW
ncbi:hypothetical protein BGW36DRAFT_463333 [Talaromyces proteolyticus]|uniref:Uncharacterized protein n=1 Tax=Talaromyces proteolyticus TaxID=1131652 RepID=A0AAD4KL50_9EURO|nr:uncharacterized protein BGW36DRAFT_463333 [Talaromyces proteolyticus]KAH8693666.1 hypothetical protein BGW36DRAFT_463333 [Talaromyces proteolyticus]